MEEFLKRILKEDGPDGVIDALSSFVGSFVITLDGVVMAASDEFLRLVGRREEGVRGVSALELVTPECRQDVAHRMREGVTGRYDVCLPTPEGNRRFAVVAPRVLEVDGRRYRLAQFIEQTELVQLQRQQIESLRGTASALSNAIEHRDPYTNGHMGRTVVIARWIAQLMELDEGAIDAVTLGASLHDIGKIAVPIEILTKPGSLQPHEWEFVRRHPRAGFEILADIDCDARVKDIVLLHHEHQDGSGYPLGLSGHEIPVEAAIVSVADCLEAIAGTRPYRPEQGFETAMEILNTEAQRHHREVLEAAGHLVVSGKLRGREFHLRPAEALSS